MILFNAVFNKSLALMWKGMLAIFVVIILIYLSIVIIGKLTGKKKETKDNK